MAPNDVTDVLASPGPVAGLQEAADRMVAIDSALPPGDGVRYFNSLYLEVTREVVRALGGGRLEDPIFLEHLAVFFSNAYFRAVDAFARAPAEASPAWRPMFAARFDRRVAPIQFALAGMNAHINYDLAIGVRDTCLALDIPPREDTPQHRDYVRLNTILGDVQERIKAQLATGLLGIIDRLLGRLDDVVAGFSVARARDAAWTHGKTLWHLREAPDLTAAHLAALERMVGLAGAGLVRPTLLGLGRWAAAQDWLPGLVKPVLGAPRGIR